MLRLSLFFLIVLQFISSSSVLCNEQEMEFIKIGWANEINGYDDYEPNESSEFSHGQRAYAYMEVTGYRVEATDGKYLTDLAVDVVLRGSFGIRLFSHTDLIDYRELHSLPPATLWFYIWVDIPRFAPRTTYQAEVIIRDRISGQKLQHQESIRIR